MEFFVNQISDRISVIVVHGNIIISIRHKPLIVVPLSCIDALYTELKQKQKERNR